jgi:hypothetical protein
VANATAIGTHTASTISTIDPHGTGAFFGRITSASHSGTTSPSQSGTVSRVALVIRTRSKAREAPRPEKGAPRAVKRGP